MADILTQENFAAALAGQALPLLVDFYRDGCVPCRRIAPIFARAEAAYEGRIAFARVNAVQNAELARSLGIAGAPTLILFKQGEEIWRHSGVITADALNAALENA